jgi:hypothetical protein
MLKRLAILGLLFTCLPVYGQEKTPKPQGDQKQPERVKQSAPNSPSVSVINSVDQQASNGKRDDTHNQPDTYLHHLILPETIANVGLFIVGVVGAFLALGTLKNIERQTKAGEIAANAALLNAQAVINAERPWLLITIKPRMGPMGGFTVHARNKGRTPAMITAAHIGFISVKKVSDLPDIPPYGTGRLVQDRIIIPGSAARIIWFDGGTVSRSLGENYPRFTWEGEIYVFGTILYRDLADPSLTSIHETRWIGRYFSPVGESGDSIFRIEGIGVADEYDRYT